MIWSATGLQAQDHVTQLALARQFSLAQDYAKSIPIYEQLYQKAPFDKSLYTEYFNDLLAAKDYAKALKLSEQMSNIRRGDLLLLADRAYVYEFLGQKKQAQPLYDSLLTLAPNDMYQLKLVAELLQKRSQYEKAIQLYEQARKQMLNDKLFAQELAILYHAKGEPAKALIAVLDQLELGSTSKDDIKSTIVSIVGSDSKLSTQLERELKQRMETNTNSIWIEMWMWYSLAKGNIKSAIAEVEKLDIKNGSNGYLLWQLGVLFQQNEQYQDALEALNAAEKINIGRSFSKEILSYKAIVMRRLLDYQRPINLSLAEQLKTVYESLFAQFPQMAMSDFYLDYASLYAYSFHQIDSAVALLQNFILMPQLRKDIRSKAKLDLGDYMLVKGNQWESTLLYAQVDKDHKEDALGELAKYKNAQLSYFIGEFDWAQEQLKVLKAASSDMIANDALYLSVLLTENMPMDTNYAPLRQFAAADLLLHQNKVKEALALWDELLVTNPETPLEDDILMKKATIFIEEGQYQQAVSLLKVLYDKHKEDVLADDALLKLATIYEQHLHNEAEALLYYEKIITEFPTSTYVQIARQKYSQLQSRSKSKV